MIAAALLLASSPSSFGMSTAGDVLQMCESSNTYEQATCMGFIIGVASRDDLVRMITPNYAYLCDFPAGVTFKQMEQVVITTLKAEPAKWHYHGGGAVARALQIAFCPAKLK